MPRIANAYDALIFAALATPVWVTVVVALMVVTHRAGLATSFIACC